MNRDKAKEVFVAYGSPQFKIGNTTMSFSRQTEKDLEDIESMTDEQLIDHWKGLVFMNEIAGNVSLNEMQRITLIELEFKERAGIDINALEEWVDYQQTHFDEDEFHN
jgi:hypothetical protein